MKKILVVIDMQNDFIDGPLGTPEAIAIVDKVCDKIRGGEWDHIFTTQDTHDDEYSETQEGRKLPVEHCIRGTEGWCIESKVCEALNEQYFTELFKYSFGDKYLPIDLSNTIIRKDGYFDDEELELTLVGVCTDICVVSNALLLKAHYPEMKIVVDASCCAGSTPEKHRMALEVMKSCQIDVVNGKKLTNADRVRLMSDSELLELMVNSDIWCDEGVCRNGDDACRLCADNWLCKESEY